VKREGWVEHKQRYYPTNKIDNKDQKLNNNEFAKNTYQLKREQRKLE